MDTTTAIVVEASSALQRARGFTVTTQAHFEAAAAELAATKGIAKRMEALRTFLKEPILEAGRRLDDMFREPRTQLEQAESAIKASMLAFTREQKRIADEESRRAHALLVEQRRQQAEAEATRVAAEAKPADDFADDFEEPAIVPEVVLAPIPAPAEAPKAKGVAVRTTWRARVTDVSAVVKAAAEGNAMAMSLLVVDERLLAQLAKSRSGNIAIPGIETFEEQTIAAQAR
jgi:hypothetical protein